MKIFRVKDYRAESFLPTYQTSPTVATAMRDAADLVRTGKVPAAHAPDYGLFLLGEDDVHSGLPELLDSPKHIINFDELTVSEDD